MAEGGQIDFTLFEPIPQSVDDDPLKGVASLAKHLVTGYWNGHVTVRADRKLHCCSLYIVLPHICVFCLFVANVEFVPWFASANTHRFPWLFVDPTQVKDRIKEMWNKVI